MAFWPEREFHHFLLTLVLTFERRMPGIQSPEPWAQSPSLVLAVSLQPREYALTKQRKDLLPTKPRRQRDLSFHSSQPQGTKGWARQQQIHSASTARGRELCQPVSSFSHSLLLHSIPLKRSHSWIDSNKSNRARVAIQAKSRIVYTFSGEYKCLPSRSSQSSGRIRKVTQ